MCYSYIYVIIIICFIYLCWAFPLISLFNGLQVLSSLLALLCGGTVGDFVSCLVLFTEGGFTGMSIFHLCSLVFESLSS